MHFPSDHRTCTSLESQSSTPVSRPEWISTLLADKPDNVRAMIIMLLCRIWSLQNERTHGKEVAPPDASKTFLCSYLSSIQQAELQSVEDIIKGKSPVVDISPKPIPV